MYRVHYSIHDSDLDRPMNYHFDIEDYAGTLQFVEVGRQQGAHDFKIVWNPYQNTD